MIGLDGYGESLMMGVLNTIQISGYSLGIGLCLGMAGAAAKLSGHKMLRGAADGITSFIRGIPELLFVLAVYLGSSVAINDAALYFGYTEYIELDAFWAGVVALSIIFGAYATEVFRGAIQAVPKGQTEAAYASGLTPFMTFRKVILPQMWRIALPGLGNLFLVLLKNTALLSVIGVQELMRKTGSAVGFTKKPFLFYLAATFLYLILTAISMVVMEWLEKKSQRGIRKVL
ncbi:ABC transporter permease [Maridesulfovibrio sp.]|uniref:ABC transporter permease n=1 Tax=Maridesulfovibrio sp. TaxID=2795000 RepID=UPI002A18D3CB|nr:ABC transporter permease [Maridesulfovibrio sp.]